MFKISQKDIKVYFKLLKLNISSNSYMHLSLLFPSIKSNGRITLSSELLGEFMS